MSLPQLAGEVLGDVMPFQTKLWKLNAWLVKVGIRDMPALAKQLCAHCDSGIEVWLAWEFLKQPGISYPKERTARLGEIELEVQAAVKKYRVDLCFRKNALRLAVECDGWEWHQKSEEQVQADYLRQRRLTCAGFTVVRFTAREIFRDAAECWQQLRSILEARS